MSFDIGVVETSIPTVNPNNDTIEVILVMHEMLKDLTTRVKRNAGIIRNLQVFGIVVSGEPSRLSFILSY